MAATRFHIIREDLMQDPLTIISDGLLIGRLQGCELLLNHPAVSRVQAGIRLVDGNYYIFGLRESNPVKINNKNLDSNAALADGDILSLGPFEIEVEILEELITLKVSLQIGRVVEATDFSSPHIGTSELFDAPSDKKKAAKPRAAPLPGDKTLDIFWDKRIREAGKMVRPSPLFPKSKRRAGKAQFNWTATTDLVSRWRVAIFVWGAIGVGLVSIAAAYWYTSAYAPGAVSNAHTRSSLQITPTIAARPNADKCTNCHSPSSSMESNCAGCHKAEGFVATVIEPHAAAGIGCVDCHAEHRGKSFRPAHAALARCTECHNDANQVAYNGRHVATPHGGTFGYPVVNTEWKWKGLNDADWALKQIDFKRQPTETDQQWRSRQFHGLHLQRVHALPGAPANAQGELSCSSCHKSFNPIDRQTPQTTCAGCHNGYTDAGTKQVLIASDKPNCISCHVQHVRDKKQWNQRFLAQQ